MNFILIKMNVSIHVDCYIELAYIAMKFGAFCVCVKIKLKDFLFPSKTIIRKS